MFEKARLKLTIWYLLIIMTISLAFSAIIYFGSTREIDRVLRVQQYRVEHPGVRMYLFQRAPWDADEIPLPPSQDVAVLEQAKIRVIESLLGINFLILLFSAFAGYFLAGRTLRPIKEMVEEQNRFITDASHELNTPLTSIKTSIEVSLRDKDFNKERAKEVLLSNLEDVNSLQILSDELIKLNQHQKVNGNVKFEKINLSAAIDHSIEKIKKQSQKKKIKIEVKIPKVFVMGDEKSITELFVILLDNAVKYSKSNSRVLITGKKTDSKIELLVEDNGIGISKEDLPFIFERFYRAEKSRNKSDYQGYGLGLSIAKKIINLHNGSIVAESELGKGTKFKIFLNTA